MAKKSRCSTQCPFWSETNKRCTVSRNGLFIPSESHIVTYCTSENHTSCSQYKDEMLMQQSTKKAYPYNRRRHPRIPAEYSLVLRYLNHSGNTIQHTSGMADTINLSSGGMQITTRKPLFNDTIVRYTYGKSAPFPEKEGLARVTWCRYQKDLMKYAAGLCFQPPSRLKVPMARNPHVTR